MTDEERVLSLLQRYLPADLSDPSTPTKTPKGRLLVGGNSETCMRREDGVLFLCLQLVTLEEDDSSLVRDIKEQEIVVVHYATNSFERSLACLEASLQGLSLVAAEFDLSVTMPYDLFPGFGLLRDPALQTVEDFAAVLTNAEKVKALLKRQAEESWIELLEPCGLGAQHEAFRALERDSIRLSFEPVEDFYDEEEDEEESQSEDREVGESCFGGAPDLPKELPWPTVNGEPLVFVAQLDLASLQNYPAAKELPKEGVLSFFYNPFSGENGSNDTCVLHFKDTTALERRSVPKGVEALKEHRFDERSERLFPGIESPFYEALLPEETVLAFRASFNTTGNGASVQIVDPLPNLERVLWGLHDPDVQERPMHRVFGYAANIQGDPYSEVEAASRSSRWKSPAWGTREALEQHRAARRWRLLLQIDANGDGELLLNQDGGFLYFWITEDALKRQAWNEVLATLQMH